MSGLSWPSVFFYRLRPNFLLKSVGTTVFMTLFFTAYIYLLREPAFPVTVMPLTAVDHWIGFQPFALPVYLSLWFYTSLPPALILGRQELVEYGLWIGLVCLIGLAFFYFLPTAVPPNVVDWSMYPGFEFLRRIDLAGNACPSLHVASAVFSGLWLHRQLGEMQARPWLYWLNFIWGAGIVYSTLATKQHVALDLLAGLLLGALGGWASLRAVRPTAR